MRKLTPLVLGAAVVTALTLSPIDFGPLPIPAGIQSAEAADTVNIDIFFSPLASHGVWVKHPKYHYVFCPKVDAKWRPYSHGHWIYMKNYGWYFASDEPYAWAVYHYGRWFHEQRLGWCWVPGNAWAGAWVAWRRGNDYVGWAPLEPNRDGFAVDVDISNQEPPKGDWVFVPPKHFLEPKLDVTVVFGDDHPDAFQKTQFAGPVVVQNNIVVNNVIDVNFIQQQTNTKVVVVDPKPVDDPSKAAADASGNTVAVFAPQIAKPKQDETVKEAVGEDQAAQQLGNQASASSASSEQPSSAASSGASSEQASSSSPSSASSSEPASTSASAAPSSSAASSSAPPSNASSAASSMVSSSSSAEPASASSSSAPAPAAPPPAKPKAAPSSSSEAPAASSNEPLASKAPASSEAASSAAASSAEKASSEPAASSEQPKPKASSQECPEGFQIVDGKCVPLELSAVKK